MVRDESETLWYPLSLDVFLNRWFTTYEEARRVLDSEGGFLLPYKHQFFVCEAPAIKAMGLDPADPDWGRIGRDCARPADEQAYWRLREKRVRAARGA